MFLANLSVIYLKLENHVLQSGPGVVGREPVGRLMFGRLTNPDQSTYILWFT